MERHHGKPAAGAQDALGRRKRRREFVQFLIHEQPQRLKRARRRMDRAGLRAHDAPDDGRRARRWCGSDASAARRTMARATARECRSSPRRKMTLARSRSEMFAITSAALGPVRAHAHVERAVVAERKSALGLIELHRRHAEIEHHAVDAAWPHCRATSSSAEKRDCTSSSRPLALSTRSAPCAIALWSRSMPITRQSAAREHRARIAAGAEGAVDIDAAVLDVEEAERGRTEHGNVTSQSASDSRFPAVAARHLSRAPRGSAAMPWALRRFRILRTAPVASESCLPKRSGAQI